MDIIPDRAWTVIAAIISALGGFVLYDRRRVDNRFSAIERDLAQYKINLAVVKETLAHLREDTQEIKQSQRELFELLSKRKR